MDQQERNSAAADLRQAAARVRWAGSRATPGPWYPLVDGSNGYWAISIVSLASNEPEVHPVVFHGSFDNEQDARWVAKLGPHVSVELAELLEEAAGWCEHGPEDNDHMARSFIRYALHLAWAILRVPVREID